MMIFLECEYNSLFPSWQPNSFQIKPNEHLVLRDFLWVDHPEKLVVYTNNVQTQAQFDLGLRMTKWWRFHSRQLQLFVFGLQTNLIIEHVAHFFLHVNYEFSPNKMTSFKN